MASMAAAAPFTMPHALEEFSSQCDNSQQPRSENAPLHPPLEASSPAIDGSIQLLIHLPLTSAHRPSPTV